MQKQVNYYEILGVEPTAKLEEIRNAYRSLALRMHPDRALINQGMERASKKENGASSGNVGSGNPNEGESIGSNPGVSTTSTTSKRASSGPGSEQIGGSVSSTSTTPAQEDDLSASARSCAASETAGSGGRSKMRGKVNFEFYQIQDAWKTLSNPSRRFLYDMRNFGSSTEFPDHDESYLLDLERAQAEKDLHQMSSYLTKVVTRETKAKGVIIMDAWYGDMAILSKFYLAFNERNSPNRVGEDGLYVDVRVATQCQVDYKSHRLIMSGGDSTSRSDLPGFYNPIPLSLRSSVELGIFIRYQFNNEVHEVLANDTESICIPKKSHTISNIAKRIRQTQDQEKELEEAAKRKQRSKTLPGVVEMLGANTEEASIAANLGICAMLTGLYLYKERDVLRQIFAPLFGGGK